MDVFVGFWHLANFFAPALGIGLFSSAVAKLLWRGELRSASWWRLWAWASGAAALASLGGLIISGRDGKMSTYVAMVLACAVGLWWAGFVSKKR